MGNGDPQRRRRGANQFYEGGGSEDDSDWGHIGWRKGAEGGEQYNVDVSLEK